MPLNFSAGETCLMNGPKPATVSKSDEIAIPQTLQKDLPGQDLDSGLDPPWFTFQ